MIQAATEPSVEDLLRRHKGLVGRIVTRYVRPNHPSIDDYMQVGRVALWRAIKLFDASRGCAFSTFAWPVIRNAVLRERNLDSLIRTGLLTKSTSPELRSAKLFARNIKSLSQDPELASGMADTAQQEENTQDDEYRAMEKQFAERVSRLNPQQERVVRLRMAGKLLREIGEELECTKSRVAQVLNRAIGKLQPEVLAPRRRPTGRPPMFGPLVPEVRRLLATGLSPRMVAERIGISRSTVRRIKDGTLVSGAAS